MRNFAAVDRLRPPRSGAVVFVGSSSVRLWQGLEGQFGSTVVLKRGFGGPPAVILGPGEPTLAHQTDEWCSMKKIEQSVDLFLGLMSQWKGR